MGSSVDGWPITVDGLLPDALPFVGPGVDQTLADIDDDPELEVIGNAATGDVIASDGDGSTIVNYDSQPQSGETVDKSKVLNLFENPVVANLDGSGGLEVVKGGQTLLGLVNLGILTGQNLPYNHVLQSWSAEPSGQGQSLPAFPQAVEDYQLLSSPAVADVSDAPGNEAIVGTGLYLIRNINSTGVEGTGWPKFTGGWNFSRALGRRHRRQRQPRGRRATREGFSFLWDTGADACGGGQRAVVDLPPRRVQQRRLRDRRAAARDAAATAGVEREGGGRPAELDRARRRLALRTRLRLPDPALHRSDRASGRRRSRAAVPGAAAARLAGSAGR